MGTGGVLRGLGVWLVISTGVLRSAGAWTPPDSQRVDFNFNCDWKYNRGEATGAQQAGFNDASWQTVSLPHTCDDDKFRDWISTRNDKPLSRPYTGVMWYRKHFTIDPSIGDRHFVLEFQGITLVGKFFVNGRVAGLHESGVGPAGVDITGMIHPGDNVVAVQVNNDGGYKTVNYHGAKLPFGEPFNPNFGGINKDVILHVTSKVYQTFPLYSNLGTLGTYIYSTNFDTLGRTADLNVEAEVKNDSNTEQTVNLDVVVLDRDGNAVLNLSAPGQSIAAGQKAVIKATGHQAGVHFWSPDFPYLYRVYTILKTADQPVDVEQTTVGIRQFTFSAVHGLAVNGHPLYLKGFAPRTSMEWPCVGVPVDWMNEFDFQLMQQCGTNFCRPMHIAPWRVQVEAADKFGIVMVVPAANNEGDTRESDIWQERLDDMRDVTIYYRNNPSVLFYEGCNQILTAQHMADMRAIKEQYDPHGGRFAGLRSNDKDVTAGSREYSCTMDGAGFQPANALWDAEYGRGEAPRRVWDEYTPMLNPRWDGKDPASKYITGGYFAIASDYHRSLGLNSGAGDFIGDYFHNGKIDFGYFRLQSSEDMVLENLAKYWARYSRSPFVQSPEVCASKGIMVGGAKIIWSDSVTDGRMRDMEVARVSGAVDGARLPKEVFYAMRVAQGDSPQVYVVGHWNYPAATTKRVYVVSNVAKVSLQTFDPSGQLIKDYGFGRNDFAASKDDQANHFVYAFENVAWQPGSIKAIGFDAAGKQVASHEKATVGEAAALKITPVFGPSGHLSADGSDVAMFDVEAVDARGNRCPTFEDRVDFTADGAGIFLGGYNSGIRDSIDFKHLNTGYHLNLECGINRVFVRATRSAGDFTLRVSGTGLTDASAKITSVPFETTGGLAIQWPQKYTVDLGPEPAAMKADSAAVPPSVAVGSKTLPVAPAANTSQTAPKTIITNFAYSGAHPDAKVVEGATVGLKVYADSDVKFDALPDYLTGAEFVQPYQADAGETSSTDQYQFDITRFCHIYLLIDSANDMPDHNNNDSYKWEKLRETATINHRPMTIYKSRLMLPYDNAYFATNGHGIDRFDPKSNMYLVMITRAEQQLVQPTLKITASSFRKGSEPLLAIDGDPKTRWAADATKPGEWLKLDLGKPCRISSIDITWYHNTAKPFKLELSDDDQTYRTAIDQQTALRGDLRFPAQAASSGRYLRVVINGERASIEEVKVSGIALDAGN